MPIDESLRIAINKRIKAGESEYVIGRATGVGQSVVYRFRTGKGISLENAAKLAKYLGLQLK
ncbi:MAG TPA: helix-turn-helix domain-containing protein [Pirellulales bacterium]|nr:helix-turn-helix domain-containing protein [Pirellulales bacterium]